MSNYYFGAQVKVDNHLVIPIYESKRDGVWKLVAFASITDSLVVPDSGYESCMLEVMEKLQAKKPQINWKLKR